ncbi:hypothetical protein D3C85_817420 [compost metagenome]
MSERTSRRAESPVTTIVSGGEAVKNHERTGDITDLEAQIAELQAIVDEKKAESRNAEAWGSGDQIITIDADGNRSDFEGYKQWRTDHEGAGDDLSNFDENGNLKTELESGDLTSLSLMQLVGEARKMNELGDRAGKQEVLDIIQDQLAERAVNEDWTEKELLFQLDRFEGLIGATEKAEAKPVSQSETTDSSAPVAEEVSEAPAGVDTAAEADNEQELDSELNPAEHPVETAVRDGESVEEYEQRIGSNNEPVPLMGDALKIDTPNVLTPQGADSDSEGSSTPAEAAEPKNDSPEAEVAPNTDKLTWKDALKNPGGYLAVKMNDLRISRENYRLSHQEVGDDHTGERRGVSDKNLKRMVGVVAGVIIAVSLYKIGSDIFGDNNVFADPGSVPNTGGGEAAPAPEVAPAPAPAAIEGSGQDWDATNFSEAARTVEAGEGFNQTFLDLGIPETEWSGLLQKVGPQLAEQGWAYPTLDGSWGISRPGTFPDSVLQLIQNNR